MSLCPGGWAHPLCELLGAGAVGAHPVAFAVDVEDDAAVEQPVEHGGGDHGVVEDLSPGPDPEVGGQHGGAFEVALGDDLEEGCGGFAGQRQVAHLIDLCRRRHKWTYAGFRNYAEARAA